MAAKQASKNQPDNTAPRDNSAVLNSLLNQIQKEFGEGAIMRLGDASATATVPVISTGAFSLDMALGVGGIPRGRIIEIYGPESSGENHSDAAHHRQRSEKRRHSRIY